MIRIARCVIAPVISAVAIAWLLAACRFGENRTDSPDALGWSDDVQACCVEWWLPFGDVQSCLDDLTEPGVCRYLNCDLVFTTYHYDSTGCP